MAAELISTSVRQPEMDAECELLGQMLAGLRQTVRWMIKRTPGPTRRQLPTWRRCATASST